MKYDESVWMKVHGERGRAALFVCCVYLPTDSSSVAVVDSCYDRLKEDVLGLISCVVRGFQCQSW